MVGRTRNIIGSHQTEAVEASPRGGYPLPRKTGMRIRPRGQRQREDRIILQIQEVPRMIGYEPDIPTYLDAQEQEDPIPSM